MKRRPLPTLDNLVDLRAIDAIVERAWPYVGEVYRHKLEMMIDIETAHEHCPLDLDRLATGNIIDLVHDVAGIYRHIDRTTGKLQNCFVPRYAKTNHTPKEENS